MIVPIHTSRLHSYCRYTALMLLLSALCWNFGARADDLFTGSVSTDSEFLKVDEAFQVTLEPNANNDGATIVWSIAPNYYLYRHKFAVSLLNDDDSAAQPLSSVSYSKGIRKSDDYYGQVEVYYYQAMATINQQDWQHIIDPKSAINSLQVSYQGCAEAGLCYPTQTRSLSIPMNTVKKSIE